MSIELNNITNGPGLQSSGNQSNIPGISIDFNQYLKGII